MNIFSLLKRFFVLLIGVFFLAFLLIKVGPSKVLDALSKADLFLVFLSSLVLLATISIKLYRWHYILSSVYKLRARFSAGTYFIGQVVNEVLPTGSGELIKLYLLKKLTSRKASFHVLPVVAERFGDVLTLLLIGFFGIALFFSGKGIEYYLLFGLALVLFISLFYFFPKKALKISSFFLRKIPFKKFSKFLEKKIIEVLSVSTSFSKKRLSAIILLSLFGWFSEAFCQMVLLSAFGYSIGFEFMVVVVAISWIAGTFSFLPGGLGAREFVYSYLLGFLGVNIVAGLSTAVVYRFITYLELGIGAGFSYFYLIRKIVK